MKFIVRWVFRLFLLLLVLGVSFLLLKDTLIKAFAERQIARETGLEVKIGKFEAGLLTPTVTIENFKLYNPAEFGGSPFIDLPEVHVEYDPKALAGRQLHFKLVRLNLSEVTVVQNEAGETNLEAIKSRLEKKAGGKEKGSSSSQVEFTGIDTLNLTLGKVNYRNLGRAKLDKTFDLGLQNRVLKNVKSEADLSAVLMEIILRNGMNFLSSGAGGVRQPAREPGLPEKAPKVTEKSPPAPKRTVAN